MLLDTSNRDNSVSLGAVDEDYGLLLFVAQVAIDILLLNFVL